VKESLFHDANHREGIVFLFPREYLPGFCLFSVLFWRGPREESGKKKKVAAGRKQEEKKD